MRKRCELVWSDPLFSVIIGYYALATQQNIPDDFSGFKDRTLCRPDGYFTFDLENEGLIPGETITLRQPGSVKDCFEMLEKGEVDFVTINRFTAEKAIAGAGLDGLVLPISSVVSSQDLHLVGHQHNPDAVRLMRGFNEGLRALKEEGRSQRITRFFMQVHQEQIDAIRAQ
jgi:polar amino acid transport system substrate-binding protein